MPGYRPQNRGNKSALRVGSVVSRRLRRAGINVSPAASRYKREGIFVAAQGLTASVFVDFGVRHQSARSAARNIADIVTSWGLKPKVTESLNEESGWLSIFIHFDYPAPAPTDRKSTAVPGWAASPSEVAAPDGMEWVRVQAGFVSATLACAGFFNSDGHVTVEQATTTAVIVRIADGAPDTVREGVSRALDRKKYTTEPNDGALIVRKLKKVKRRLT